MNSRLKYLAPFLLVVIAATWMLQVAPTRESSEGEDFEGSPIEAEWKGETPRAIATIEFEPSEEMARSPGVPASEIEWAPEPRRVQVRDTATGFPVSGAEVWFQVDAVPDKLFQSHHEWHGRRDPFGADDSSRPSFVTDSKGEARVPEWVGSQGVQTIAVRKGERFGAIRSEALDNLPWVVHIEEHYAQEVYVVTADGEPAPGVSLKAIGGHSNGRWRSPMDGPGTLAVTDRHGHARFSDPDLYLDEADAPFRVSPIFPRFQECEFESQWQGGRFRPMRIVLPETRSLTVKLRMPNGAPPSRPVTVHISPGVPNEGMRGAIVSSCMMSAVTCDRNGNAHFLHIGLMRSLRVEAWNVEYREYLMEVFGNSRLDGIPSEVEILWKPDSACFTGMLVDIDGRPIEHANLSAAFTHEFGKASPLTLMPGGKFEIRALPVPDESHYLRIESKVAGHPYQGMLPIPQLLHGVRDLGDVVLSPLELAAAGQVLDAAHRPCPGVEVTITRPERKATGFPEADARMHRLPTSWGAISDQSGQFKIYIDPQPASVNLKLSARKWGVGERSSQPVSMGVADLSIVLNSGETGEIRAQILLPDGVAHQSAFWMQLLEDSTRQWSPYPVSHLPESSTLSGKLLTARWDNLSLGSYTLEIYAPFWDKDEIGQAKTDLLELCEIKNIWVTADATQDPRLRLIDLSPFTKAVKLKFLNRSLLNRKKIPITVRSTDGRTLKWHAHAKEDHFVALVPRESATATIDLPGFMPIKLDPLLPTNVATLSETPLVCFTVRGTDISRGPCWIKCMSTKGNWSCHRLQPEEDGRVWRSNDVPMRPGTYQARVASSVEEEVDAEPLPTVTLRVIPNTSTVQVIRIGPR